MILGSVSKENACWFDEKDASKNNDLGTSPKSFSRRNRKYDWVAEIDTVKEKQNYFFVFDVFVMVKKSSGFSLHFIIPFKLGVCNRKTRH